MAQKIQSYLTQQQTNDYVKSHGDLLGNGQVFLTKPLMAFKKVYYDHDSDGRKCHAIASLIIPVGCLVNLAQTQDCKLRASDAFTWSIRDVNKPKRYVEEAYSGHDSDFYYLSEEYEYHEYDDQDVQERLDEVLEILGDWSWRDKFRQHEDNEPVAFDFSTEECSGGIHFFIEVDRAKDW